MLTLDAVMEGNNSDLLKRLLFYRIHMTVVVQLVQGNNGPCEVDGNQINVLNQNRLLLVVNVDLWVPTDNVSTLV